MKKETLPMLMFWAMLLFFWEWIMDLLFMHTGKGFWYLLFIAVLQAVPYLAYQYGAQNYKKKIAILIYVEVIVLIFLLSFVLGMIITPKIRIAKRIIPVGTRIGIQTIMLIIANKYM